MSHLSIITAFFNEADNLPVYKTQLRSILTDSMFEYEIVLVDDHSNDASSVLAREWADEDPNVQYIRLSRNCGSHAAFSAGLANCTGDCAVLLAADLQDPPELIPELLQHWQEGNDVVWAVRAARDGESWSTKLFAGAYYRLMRKVALPEMPSRGADFLLMDRKVIDAYNAILEKHTSFLAMILWMGFRQTSIEYDKQARNSGQSKWTFWKKVKLTIDSLVSFSYVPIRAMSVVGMSVSLIGFLYALYVVYQALVGNPVQGWSSLIVVILVLGGLQLLTLGILGEYLWRTFDEARGRPRYIVEEHIRSADHREPLAASYRHRSHVAETSQVPAGLLEEDEAI